MIPKVNSVVIVDLDTAAADDRFGPPMSEAESLRRFGTVTFGVSFIKAAVEMDPWSASIEIGRWVEFVPRAYLDYVEPAVKAAADRGQLVGSPMTERTLDVLAMLISGWVSKNGERRDPVPDPEPGF